MRLKVGQKLQEIRARKQATQAEFAELFSISPAAYSRLERDETFADVNQLLKFSEQLDVPIQKFLPDTITSYFAQNGQGGVQNVYGNFNYYANATEREKQLETENEMLRKTLKEALERLEKLEAKM